MNAIACFGLFWRYFGIALSDDPPTGVLECLSGKEHRKKMTGLDVLVLLVTVVHSWLVAMSVSARSGAYVSIDIGEKIGVVVFAFCVK